MIGCVASRGQEISYCRYNNYLYLLTLKLRFILRTLEKAVEEIMSLDRRCDAGPELLLTGCCGQIVFKPQKHVAMGAKHKITSVMFFYKNKLHSSCCGRKKLVFFPILAFVLHYPAEHQHLMCTHPGLRTSVNY